MNFDQIILEARKADEETLEELKQIEEKARKGDK